VNLDHPAKAFWVLASVCARPRSHQAHHLRQLFGRPGAKLSNDFEPFFTVPVSRPLSHTRVGKYKDSEGEIELTRKPLDAQSVQKRTAVNQWYTNTLYSRLDNKLIAPSLS